MPDRIIAEPLFLPKKPIINTPERVRILKAIRAHRKTIENLYDDVDKHDLEVQKLNG